MLKTSELVKQAINIDYKHGNTALMYVALCGRTDAVQVLIANGADVAARDKHGKTALMYAALCGHRDVVEVLQRAEEIAPERGVIRDSTAGRTVPTP